MNGPIDLILFLFETIYETGRFEDLRRNLCNICLHVKKQKEHDRFSCAGFAQAGGEEELLCEWPQPSAATSQVKRIHKELSSNCGFLPTTTERSHFHTTVGSGGMTKRLCTLHQASNDMGKILAIARQL